MAYNLTIQEILKAAVVLGATDVHLVVGSPPVFRIHGDLHHSKSEPFKKEELQQLLDGMVTDKQKVIFAENHELDFSFFGLENYYFRVNVHVDRGYPAATIRIMPNQIGSSDQLGLPPAIDQIARLRKGMVLVTGQAGSGKTTTMNYLINRINHERRCKIITIEDPIEYLHQSRESLIVQREVGLHTKSFSTALKYALRQDPDVVVVGEMRDPESISMALTTAHTGHLVLATLHAPDAVESLNRIIDVYPAAQQNQIRLQLSEAVAAVIGQQLMPRKDAVGRVLATEILTVNLSIRNIIKRAAFQELRGHMEMDEGSGMHTLEQCLSELFYKGLISEDTAKIYAKYPNMLKLDHTYRPRQQPTSASAEAKKPTG